MWGSSCFVQSKDKTSYLLPSVLSGRATGRESRDLNLSPETDRSNRPESYDKGMQVVCIRRLLCYVPGPAFAGRRNPLYL